MKEALKKMRWQSVAKRILLIPIPIVMLPLGISGYFAAMLGSDPYSVFLDGMHVLTEITRGRVAMLIGVVLITLMIFFDRKYLGVGTVTLTLTIGPLIDLFLPMLTAAMYTTGEPDLFLRVVVLVSGALILSVGVGVFVAIDFGIGALEWVVILISKRFSTSVGRAKIVLDAALVATGWLMGGLVGVGTIVGIAATGLLIDVTLKCVRGPIKRFVGPLRNEENDV